MDERIIRMAKLINNAHCCIFFGGAGVSTESGIPDFRSVDGLYNKTWKYPPEIILSHDFFVNHTKEFYQFYRQKMLFPNAKPNAAHKALAALEASDKLYAVITQNIDGLHQAAGSKHVIELHGTVHTNHCVACGKEYGLDAVLNSQEDIPICSCGGILKPDVVLYGESLPTQALEDASQATQRADLMIVGGTSLAVYPAAGFVNAFSGTLIIVNRSPTPLDHQADLVIDLSIGEAFSECMKLL